MDLWDVLKVAVRQWAVLVPLLVLTAALTLVVGGTIDPEYAADGAFLLVGPNEALVEPVPAQPGDTAAPAVEPEPLNPYLSFSASLPITAQALSLRLTGSRARELLADADLSTTYEVVVDSRSPITKITATGDDPATTVATLDRLIELASEELAAIQVTQGAPEGQLIAIDVLEQNTGATIDYGARNRVRLMLLALGLVGSVVAAYATEGFLAWRESPAARRHAVDGDIDGDIDEAWNGDAAPGGGSRADEPFHDAPTAERARPTSDERLGRRRWPSPLVTAGDQSGDVRSSQWPQP